MGTLKESKRSRKKSYFIFLFVAAVFFSLGIHVLAYKRVKEWKMEGFSVENYDRIVPRTFRMKRVEIDPKTLEVPKPTATPSLPNERKQVALDKESPGKALDTTPSDRGKKEMAVPRETIVDNPSSDAVGLGIDLELKKAMTSTELPLEDRSVMAIPLATNSGGSGAVALPSGITNTFSSLDGLLAGVGSVEPGAPPILMPTDLLFEYDSDGLKPEAAETLNKLGTLIKKNMHSRFTIEGHTDSFGSDEYNEKLSLRRAVAVKEWLEKNMDMRDADIRAVGYGKRRLITPSSGSIEEQQLNRRVEIVISRN